jgi:ATP-dependent DNA helicase RecG
MSVRLDLAQLSQRESEQVAWEEDVADADDVVATLCAFANDLQSLGGGYVVCGAAERRDAHGFPVIARVGLTASRLREIEGTVLTRCRERVSPPLTPLVEELEADTPDRRVLVFVQPATGAAHTFRRAHEGALRPRQPRDARGPQRRPAGAARAQGGAPAVGPPGLPRSDA